MKKKIISILSIILFVCLICSITYASETNVTLEKNKEKYTSGDVVEISVKVNDITLENGIETIVGTICYNKDLYENCVIEESNSWEADYNNENGKIILQRNEGIKENHIVFVIKLTVKENIVNNDTISFTDINIADEETDLFPQDITITINIEDASLDPDENPEGTPEQTPNENPEGTPGQTPENNPSGTPEKSIDEIAKELFEKGTYEIRKLIYGGNEYTIANPEEIKEINDKEYIKTTEKYEIVKEKYATIFTGEALENVLSKKFVNVDGTLYIENAWGATGEDITNIQIEKVKEENGEITYKATYNKINVDESISEEKYSCEFKIKEVDGEYRISAINYLDIDKKEEKKENNTLGDKTNSEDVNQDNTKTEDEMPYTGTLSVLGMMIIIVVFGILSLAKYNKYKKI